MKYIANILTDKKFTDNELYNVVGTKDALIQGLPTLVIGWEFTKMMYPHSNIIDWKIDDDTYWTFGNRERRDRYEENIKKFREMATNRIIKSIGYDFFSVLISDEDSKHTFFNQIKAAPTTVYISGDMVYTFTEGSSSVVGFSLKDLDYEHKDRRKIFSCLNRNGGINIVDGSALSFNTKNSLRNCKYIIPYLCS